MPDEPKYSHRLMRDAILKKVLILRGDLLRLAGDQSVSFAMQLAIKSLAHDVDLLDDVLNEYVTARTEEDAGRTP